MASGFFENRRKRNEKKTKRHNETTPTKPCASVRVSIMRCFRPHRPSERSHHRSAGNPRRHHQSHRYRLHRATEFRLRTGRRPNCACDPGLRRLLQAGTYFGLRNQLRFEHDYRRRIHCHRDAGNYHGHHRKRARHWNYRTLRFDLNHDHARSPRSAGIRQHIATEVSR